MKPNQARNLFPITNRRIYLNHAEAGPISYRVEAAVDGLGSDADPRSAARDTALSLAHLFDVPAETISLTGAGEDGMALLARGVDWRPGDNVVLSEGAPGDEARCWRAPASRGVELRRVPRVDGRVMPDHVIARIDDATRVVALPHVDSWSGVRLDAATIGHECDRRGVVFALGADHSAGVLRLDLSALPVDYLVAGAGRWLMGPATAGVRYCRPELMRRLKARPGAGPTAVDAVALGAAADLLLEVGPAQVESHVLGLARALAEGLRERGYELLPPSPRDAAEGSAIVSFRRPGAAAVEVMRDLQAAGAVASAPGDFVRLSPHFCNSEVDVAMVLDVLAPRGALA